MIHIDLTLLAIPNLVFALFTWAGGHFAVAFWMIQTVSRSHPDFAKTPSRKLTVSVALGALMGLISYFIWRSFF